MGRIAAEGMAEQGLTMEQLLHWHLKYNHYPPLPDSAIAIAKQALDLAPEWDAEVDNVWHEDGSPVTVSEVFQAYHLDGLLLDEVE